ncbi:hypothetical protein NL676_004915 [Syzygium grande]|nr:hypothetical protein NL676_004915 [Syzygium grande]
MPREPANPSGVYGEMALEVGDRSMVYNLVQGQTSVEQGYVFSHRTHGLRQAHPMENPPRPDRTGPATRRIGSRCPNLDDRSRYASTKEVEASSEFQDLHARLNRPDQRFRRETQQDLHRYFIWKACHDLQRTSRLLNFGVAHEFEYKLVTNHLETT